MIGVYLLEGAYLGKVFLNTQGAEPDADSRGNMQWGVLNAQESQTLNELL